MINPIRQLLTWHRERRNQRRIGKLFINLDRHWRQACGGKGWIRFEFKVGGAVVQFTAPEVTTTDELIVVLRDFEDILAKLRDGDFEDVNDIGD